MVTEVTRETRQSEVVPLTDLRIRDTRSSTQPADRRASASWSQHSSMVTQSWARPCTSVQRGKRERTALSVALSRQAWGTGELEDVPEDQAEPTGPNPSSRSASRGQGDLAGIRTPSFPAVTILSPLASLHSLSTGRDRAGNAGHSWGMPWGSDIQTSYVISNHAGAHRAQLQLQWGPQEGFTPPIPLPTTPRAPPESLVHKA